MQFDFICDTDLFRILRFIFTCKATLICQEFDGSLNYDFDCSSALTGSGDLTLLIGDSSLSVYDLEVSYWHCAAVGES